MSSIKSYLPKETITLFDHHQDQQIKGVMYFTKQQKPDKTVALEITETKRPSARWINNRYTAPKYDLLNFKSLAVLCFMVAIIGFTSLVLPIAMAETRLRFNYFQNNTNLFQNVAAATKTPNPVESLSPTPEPLDFSLSIPRINLQTVVIPDVNPKEDTIYNEQLKTGVAQARGSYLPGQKGTIFLFGHSTDTPEHITEYNARFYAVKDLENGDEIDINYHGRNYTYKIYDRKITSPFDLDTIRNSNADLILQTCWPPGTDWQRLMVFAKQI